MDVESFLHATALDLADVEVGVACAGTALEATTYNTRKKAFLFVQSSRGAVFIRLKLPKGHSEAAHVAGQDKRVNIGATGWVTVKLGADDSTLNPTLDRWVRESHGLLAAGTGAIRRSRGTEGHKRRNS